MRVIYSLEDDLDIQKIISLSLSKVNYQVCSFDKAETFFEAFESKKPDMCLLDLMLPDASGFEVLKKIRSDDSNKKIKIIIISAKRMTADKVEGLDLGADDYIEKPFEVLELISRVNARFRDETSSLLSYNNIKLDTNKHLVLVSDKEVDLTNFEFNLLKVLLSNLSKVVTREEIYASAYGSEGAFESRTIDMHVASLRKKISDKDGKIIRTIYGVGYVIG